jgi:hypothetical protein
VSSFIAAGGNCAGGPDRYNHDKRTDHDHRCGSNRDDDDGRCAEHAVDIRALRDARNSGCDRHDTGYGDRDDSDKKACNGWYREL